MGFSLRTALKVASLAWVGTVAALPRALSTSLTDLQPDAEIITRDVVIIGGGSSGTYAAIRLREDLGKSVIVVEQKDKLGGHTETYTDPSTGEHIDIGVVVWHDQPLVKDYFARLGVPLMKLSIATLASAVSTKYVDFGLGGKPVTDFVPVDPTPGLAAYAAQLARFSYVENGFNLSYPVPEELLMPFGEFAARYNISSAMPYIVSFAQGLGDILDLPTLYIFKNFGSEILGNIQTGFLTTAAHNNHALYEAALALLGTKDVLLSSTIVSTDRSEARSNNKTDTPVEVLVQTPTGQKLIRAKSVLLTAPPKLDNLQAWDLSHNERRLFSQFRNAGYYTTLLRNTGIPANVSIQNIGSNRPFNTLSMPGLYDVSPTTPPGFFSVKYSSASTLPDSVVQADILASIRRLYENGVVVAENGTTAVDPEFVTFSSHAPFELTVPAEAIADGFYRDLYALQGQHYTFYTGAAFHTHDSSMLWNFTETVLPIIVAAT